jgi:RND family efflux transporter MFP subunit
MESSAPLLSEIRRRSRRRKIVIVLLVLLLVGGGGGAYAYRAGYFGSAKKSETVATVQYSTVSTGSVTRSIESDGTISNTASVDLSFDTSGTIKTMGVEVGDVVKVGDPIATLDTADLQFQISKADLSLASAKASLAERLQGATDIEIKMSKASIASAKANVEDVKRKNAYDLATSELAVQNALKNLEIAKKQTTSTADQTADNRKSLELDIATLETNRTKTTDEYHESVNKAELGLSQLAESIAVRLNADAADLGETLDSLDEILEIDNPNQVYNLTNYYSATDLTTREASKDAYRALLGRYRSEVEGVFPVDASTAASRVDTLLDTMESLHADLRDVSDTVYRGLDASIPAGTFTSTVISNFKNAVSGYRSSAASVISSVRSDRQSLESKRLDRSLLDTSYARSIAALDDSLKAKELAISSLGAKESDTAASIESKIYSAQKAYDDSVRDLANLKLEQASNLDKAERSVTDAEDSLAKLTLAPTETDLASSRLSVKNAEISLAQAKSDLAKATLSSPIRGTVVETNYSAGETVRSDTETPVVVLVNSDSYELEASIEEGDIGSVFVGQKVKITIDALPGVSLSGEVRRVGYSAETSSSGIVAYKVLVRIDASDSTGIKDGMTARAEFIVESAENVLTVPVSAVKSHDGKPSVKLEDGTWAAVETGVTDGSTVAVTGSIQAGARIVTNP